VASKFFLKLSLYCAHVRALNQVKPMSKDSVAAATYLKFMNLMQSIRAEPSFPKMDAVEEKLLNYFASCWHTGKSLTVVETMNSNAEIPPRTMHRRLASLHEKGLVEFQQDPLDKRIKYIVSTEKAAKLFAQMGKCLDISSQNGI
jgi:hypothetical protein